MMISMELIVLLQKHIDSGFKNNDIFAEKFVHEFDGVRIATFSLKNYSCFQFSMREDNKTPVMIDFSLPTLGGKVLKEPFLSVLTQMLEEENAAL